MNDNDATIAARLTPLAPGGIAVIGVCGPRTDEILAGLLWQMKHDQPPVLRDDSPTLCRVRDSVGVIDDAVVSRSSGEGPPQAEICTHGGVRIVQRVLMALAAAGPKIVSDAEFFERNSLAQNPIVRDVDRALLSARSRRLAEWLLTQRAILPGYLKSLAKLSDAEREAFRRRSEVATRLLAGMSIVIVGPPNAGKSTLANRLIGSERVITSDTPGTTRDWVRETAIIAGWPVTLTDTAGLRETACAIESEAIRRGKGQIAGADLVLVVLDTTRPIAERESAVGSIATTIDDGIPRLIVLNKCDQLPESALNESTTEYVSALRGTGLDRLENRIAQMLGLNLLQDHQPAFFTPAQSRQNQLGSPLPSNLRRR